MTVDVERACGRCGGPLPRGSRADRIYCTNGCRQSAYEERQRLARVRLVTGEPADESAAQLARLREAVIAAVDETKLLAVIAAEARHNWRASAWLLSRIHPARWGERGRDTPLALGDDPNDPFREVDELAEARSARRRPDGY